MASKPKLVVEQQFAIIKGVPIPPRATGVSVYPFAQMEIGDSFDAPRDMGARRNGCRRQNVISNCALAWAKKHCPTAKFTTRLIDANTVRCWRVA